MTVLVTENNTGSANGTTVTQNCVTPAYTAGPGQRALIWAHLNCPVPAGNAIDILPSYTTNAGGTYFSTATFYSVQSNPSAVATFYVEADHFGTVGLIAGTTYQFATQGLLNAAGTASGCACKTMAEIVGN